MNMPEVTLTFKCGVIGANGQVNPDSYKFLTWSYVAGNSTVSDTASFSHISLAQRVLSVYPHLADETTRIVYVDEENDRIAIPCDNIKETLAALRVISKGHLDEQESPIRIFIQLVSTTSAPASTGNCLGNAHPDLLCSICKAEITGFVYKCLQCDNDFTLCGRCDTAGKHSEHVVVRFVGDQLPSLSEMKQILSSQHEDHSAVETTKIKLKTCTLRVL
jgi:hypothetical protein